MTDTNAATNTGPKPATDAAKPATQGVFRRAMHRLTSPEHVLDAERRQEEAVEQGGTPVGRCADRQQVCVVGQLRTVTIQPRGQSPALQAELWDGSGTVDLVWIGRRKIVGIEPGRVLRAEGRITLREGRRVMFNPRYELRPATS